MGKNLMTALHEHRYDIAKAAALCATVAVLVLYDFWAVGTAEADAAVRAQAMEDARGGGSGPYPADGVFSGSAEGYGGTVTSQVTVENGWITAVDVVDASHEDAAWLEMAMVLPERILEAQTPAIDVVSGATFTSTGILNGVTEALLDSLETGGEAQ